jgi:hypothetical protein
MFAQRRQHLLGVAALDVQTESGALGIERQAHPFVRDIDDVRLLFRQHERQNFKCTCWSGIGTSILINEPDLMRSRMSTGDSGRTAPTAETQQTPTAGTRREK